MIAVAALGRLIRRHLVQRATRDRGLMRVCSRDAAARRRRGVLARAAYAMRKARRGGTVSESSRAPPAFAASPGDTLPEPRGKRRRRRMPRCALPLSRRVYGPAEVRAAIV